ncbi:MAG: hypothetical protein JWM27_1237 [Gemmatimonadetes bacterium]|nr:hypothetical protein [Gemmatimonadota bacterium]
MSRETPEMAAARRVAEDAGSVLHRSPAFQALSVDQRDALLRDLGTIRRGLAEQQAADPYAMHAPTRDPYALALETPFDRVRHGPASPASTDAENGPSNAPAADTPKPPAVAGPRQAATETLAKRAGALVDEIDFPAFVAGLVHNTFDALVEASIRQMEAFADLVSTVARGVDDFTRDNISDNQARDSLRDKYPGDLVLEIPKPGEEGTPKLRARANGAGEDAEPRSPEWLKDYGLEGQPLTDELIEEAILPAARKHLGESRLQMLSTMVLLGMNRINVKDGSISAKVRFRAAARDNAAVSYAVNSDPGGGGQGWGQKGSGSYAAPATMVSTVGVNVQSDTELKAELFGEVKINFVSETLPLDRFADAAQLQILQGNSRTPPSPKNAVAAPAAVTPPAALAPTPIPAAAPMPVPVPVAAAPAAGVPA